MSYNSWNFNHTVTLNWMDPVTKYEHDLKIEFNCQGYEDDGRSEHIDNWEPPHGDNECTLIKMSGECKGWSEDKKQAVFEELREEIDEAANQHGRESGYYGL